jgi:hypothetical protein
MTANQPTTQNKYKSLWIGLGAASLLFCCAVLVAFLVFREVGKKVQSGLQMDPESAAQSAREFVDYDLPDGYTEQMAMDMIVYTFVIIGPASYENTGPTIMFAHFSPVAGNQQQLEQQVRQSFNQQVGGADMTLVEIKTMTIRGEETEVAIYEGLDEYGDEVRQLITSFPARTGIIMLMIFGDIETWDQDMVDEFIESIR